MPAQIFLSCGQNEEEDNIAGMIKKKLQKKGFNVYRARSTQSIEDVNKSIINGLETSDYFLFIDFKREELKEEKDKDKYRGSLYSHQELVLAHYMNFEIIALGQEYVKSEGISKYILINPHKFKDTKGLPDRVIELVKEKQWNINYSRHLTIGKPYCNISQYPDHQGFSKQIVFQCKISNTLKYKDARGVRAILKEVKEPFRKSYQKYIDGRFLKWAGHKDCYEQIIPRNNSRNLDMCCIHLERANAKMEEYGPLYVYLHDDNDAPRKPINKGKKGELKLKYALFAEGFPEIEFSIGIGLDRNIKINKDIINQKIRLIEVIKK